MNKFLLVGLGNVGPQFENTRHNLGITVLRAWVEHMRTQPGFEVDQWQEDSNEPFLQVRVSSLESRVSCLFPLTMMNESGRAVAGYLKNNPVDPQQIIVAYDDLEVPLGDIKVTVGGSARGHNGLRSIQTALGTQEVTRLRLGIGRPPDGASAHDFVLGKFTPDEQPVIEQLKSRAGTSISDLLQQKMSP